MFMSEHLAHMPDRLNACRQRQTTTATPLHESSFDKRRKGRRPGAYHPAARGLADVHLQCRRGGKGARLDRANERFHCRQAIHVPIRLSGCPRRQGRRRLPETYEGGGGLMTSEVLDDMLVRLTERSTRSWIG